MLISPLHDKDIDKEGNPKKPHYHVILIFESLKSPKQVKEIIDIFGGVGTIPLHSLGAYSRYLCHIDNPEKAQYNKEDVKEIGGANYKECCRKNEDKENEANLIELTQIILEKRITYFHEVADLIIKEHNELFSVLKQNSYYIHSIVMSLATQTQKGKESNTMIVTAKDLEIRGKEKKISNKRQKFFCVYCADFCLYFSAALTDTRLPVFLLVKIDLTLY